MIPALSLRGMAIMGALGALLIAAVRPASAPDGPASGDRIEALGFLAQMFFLGAGFMLIETKAVVQMALLFGSTWMVNSIVFCAVLVMILLANLFVLAVRPRSLTPFYVGLAVSLAASAIVPLDAFLGLSRGAADRRLVRAGVHAGALCGRGVRDLVQPRGRCGPRVRRERRRRDGRRARRVQLDAARLPICRPRGAAASTCSRPSAGSGRSLGGRD